MCMSKKGGNRRWERIAESLKRNTYQGPRDGSMHASDTESQFIKEDQHSFRRMTNPRSLRKWIKIERLRWGQEPLIIFQTAWLPCHLGLMYRYLTTSICISLWGMPLGASEEERHGNDTLQTCLVWGATDPTASHLTLCNNVPEAFKV